MIEEYRRTELLIGSDKVETLHQKCVMVLGIGGVGSHCAEALARTGIGTLMLVDHDQISLSNINRQSIAYHSTVGQYKTQVMKERIRDIDPDIRVLTQEVFVLPDKIEEVFQRPVDYIVDAIDTVTAKLAVVEFAKKKQIPMISCMGTGNKLHPEQFEIADINETSVCPLCKVMRKELKSRNIQGLQVLYSKEKPVDISQRVTKEELGGKRALPGSIAFVPSVAGLLIAGKVIRDLAKIE
ncbi:MAG: tRNA threonylcarbamoyladenosine dehydratase [Lachnospiraceae bacterium]